MGLSSIEWSEYNDLIKISLLLNIEMKKYYDDIDLY